MIADRLSNLSLALLVLVGSMLTGCTTSPKTTDSARSTMEQLLLAQALERTLVDARMPIDPAESVAVEAVGLTGDTGYAKSIVEEWLRKKGLHVGGRLRNIWSG